MTHLPKTSCHTKNTGRAGGDGSTRFAFPNDVGAQPLLSPENLEGDFLHRDIPAVHGIRRQLGIDSCVNVSLRKFQGIAQGFQTKLSNLDLFLYMAMRIETWNEDGTWEASARIPFFSAFGSRIPFSTPDY